MCLIRHNLFPMTQPRENSYTRAQGDMYEDAHCRLFKSEKCETTQTVTVKYSFNGILYNGENEAYIDMDKFQKYKPKRKLQKYMKDGYNRMQFI